jgi:hypothetical protein
MTANFIQSFRAMESGTPTVYYKNKTSSETKKKDETPNSTEQPSEE